VLYNSGPQPPGGGLIGTGPRNYKMYTGTGGDPIRSLSMWLVDSSHGNTAARAEAKRHRVLQGRDKIVKRWPVRGYRKVGDHCFIATTDVLSLTETVIHEHRRRKRQRVWGMTAPIGGSGQTYRIQELALSILRH